MGYTIQIMEINMLMILSNVISDQIILLVKISSLSGLTNINKRALLLCLEKIGKLATLLIFRSHLAEEVNSFYSLHQ